MTIQDFANQMGHTYGTASGARRALDKGHLGGGEPRVVERADGRFAAIAVFPVNFDGAGVMVALHSNSGRIGVFAL